MDRTHLQADRMGPVLVTGASGFIGRPLVALLRRSGADVHTAGTVDGDLRRLDDARALVGHHRPRAIVNLARPTHAGDRDLDHGGHVEMATNLLAAARAAGVSRLVHLGSSTEFGEAESPVDDDAPLRPTTPFGRAKATASSLVLAADEGGVRTTVLRPFSVYGPNDLRRHLVPAAIRAALAGRRLPLASGVARDWVFVEDVAFGCALALDGRADGLALNLASGVAVPNERVVELVGDAAGRRIEIDPAAMPPRKWDAGLAGSTERARRTLGWQARTALSEGIGMTLALARDETRNTRLAAAR